MAKITLPDKSVREVPDGTTVRQFAESIGKRLAKDAVIAEVDGQPVDLFFPLAGDRSVRIITRQMPESLDHLRHSCAHIMAQAVQRLYPGTRLAIGPPIEDGFYYDMDPERPFTPEDIEKIDAEMQKIVAQNFPFSRSELRRSEAIERMKAEKQTYKVEMLEEWTDETVSFYTQGEFTDLCRGPHVAATGAVPVVKVLRATGAYWRGDEKNRMLQRLYGTAWWSKEDLDLYVSRQEEAKKRDHRKLGKELDLFSVHDEIGSGLIHWHPRGSMIRHVIEEEWKKEHVKRGYLMVDTPHIASEEIYRISGHLEAYKDLMYGAMMIEERPFRVKPMNCPGHIMIYKSHLHSYRELPMRLAELGTVYRFEKSGVLHGLLRVRGFTIDDAHIFVSPQSVEKEIVDVFRFAVEWLAKFGFKDLSIYLSTRPEKSVGASEDWERTEHALRNALSSAGVKFEVDEGGGAFYGPKIDVKVRDSLGREWQCSTVQFDFNLPSSQRFDLSYVSEDGGRKQPYMVHRALMGSLERFFGVLIEHYGGAFPVWLAATQATVIPIADAHIGYAGQVAEGLRLRGFRVDVDARNERTGHKIREATLLKTPYMLVVGEKEVAAKQVAVRERSGKDLGVMNVDRFEQLLAEDIAARR
ncbi:MAG: threonine--tRNA ligase [Candidatus Brocadiae bacterium]|nr:threonine--tRNA ligase [Candidatus Brocadiia bacterium]